MLDDELLDDAPPPAYEVSQQELDRKISLAVEQSLTISQPSQDPDEDAWEAWDDALFERNAAAAAGSSSSPTAPGPNSASSASGSTSSASSSSVQPLRIVKKKKNRPNSSAGEKHRLTLAVPNEELVDEISAPSYQESQSGPSAGAPMVHHIPEEDDYDDLSAPPPPFAPVQCGQDVAWSDSDSRIASPLSSPTLRPTNRLPSTPRNPPARPPSIASTASSSNSQTPSTFRPVVTPRRQPNRAGSRPSTSYTPQSRNSVWDPASVRVHFDSSMAYAKPSTFGKLPMDDHPASSSVNAVSFYKHAVAAHMSPLPATPRRASVGQANNRMSTASVYGEPSGFDNRNMPLTPNRAEALGPQSMMTNSVHSFEGNSPPSSSPFPHVRMTTISPQGLYAQPLTQRSSQPFQQQMPMTVTGPHRWAASEHDITRDIYH